MPPREYVTHDELDAALHGMSGALGAQGGKVDRLWGWRKRMEADESFGRMLSGPQWISNVSVRDGSITASKITVTDLAAIKTSTGSLNVTGTITAGTAGAARVEISAAGGIKGFNATPATVWAFNIDGSGQIGIGATAITWNTAGALSVPVASIGTLTIADITSGTLGGAYVTAAAGAHMKLSTAGLTGYSATTENNANTRFSLLTDGSGFLGAHPGKIVWSTAGVVTINGDTVINGTLAANAITSGTLTSGATVNVGTADLVVNSTGKIKFGTSSADYLADDFLHFEVPTGNTAKIEWRNAAQPYYSDIRANASSSSSNIRVAARNDSNNAIGMVTIGSSATAASTFVTINAQPTSGVIEAQINVTGAPEITLKLDDGGGTLRSMVAVEQTNYRTRFAGRIYPGSGSGSGLQTTRYIDDDGTYMRLIGPISYRGGSPGGSPSNWSGFGTANIPNTTAGFVKIEIEGLGLFRFPFYNDA